MATEIIDAPAIETLEDETTPKPNPRTGQTALTLSLAGIAGFGLTIIIVALGWGVIDGNANGDVIGMLIVAGAFTLILGIGAWAGLVRPWESFDDINEPQYHGHHHDDDHSDDDAEATH